MKSFLKKSRTIQRKLDDLATGRSASVQSSTLQFVNLRPDSTVQQRLQEAAHSSPRQYQLVQQQAVAQERSGAEQARQVQLRADDGVVQRQGGSTAPYDKHKDGDGDSKWDDATNKKEEIWKEMDRSGFQEGTADLLGVTKATETPTTNHILSKSRLPRFEFNLANLRFGPNAALRADDPNQAPDYNIGHDGELTPRSKRIATSFESGKKEELRKTFSEEGHRKIERQDFDQWYISKDHWDTIARDWAQKDEFWQTHREEYYVVDYSSQVDDGHKGSVVPGIAWTTTKLIAEKEKGKFKDLKKFISRGGKVQNKEQKEVLSSFREFKESKIDQLVERYQLQGAVALANGIGPVDMTQIGNRLQKDSRKLCSPIVDKLTAFDHKTDRAKEKLDLRSQELEAECETALKLGWQETASEKKKRNATGLTRVLNEAHSAWVRESESLWLQEFKTDKKERQAPFHLAGEERKSFLAAESRKALEDILTTNRKELISDDNLLPDNELLRECLSPLLEEMKEKKREICEKIDAWEKEGVVSVYYVEKIQQQLGQYGFDYKLKLGKQPKTIPNVSAFLADAIRWRDANSWINVFQKKLPPAQSNETLHNLLNQLIGRFTEK
jgi:hypothetical protein